MSVEGDTMSGDGVEHAVCVNCHEKITASGDEPDLWFRPDVDWTIDYNVLCAGVPKDSPNYEPYPNKGDKFLNRHMPADKFVMWCIQLTEDA